MLSKFFGVLVLFEVAMLFLYGFTVDYAEGLSGALLTVQ